jgi:large subunit ribosomal protein L24
MERIRKGDEVVVISGRDKGKRGTVLARVDERHVTVEGINIVKKHVKPNPMKGVAGGIMDKTLPIDISNVMLWNAATGKGDRVGIKSVDGKKVRVFKSNGATVGAK